MTGLTNAGRFLISRRAALAGLIAVPPLTALGKDCDNQSVAASLSKIGAGKGITVGAAISVQELNDEDKALFLSEISSVTPETEMKMAAIRPQREDWKFEPADAIVEFAVTNQVGIRGHTLIWNNDQQPAWLNLLSTTDMQAVMDEHIEVTMSRYAGRVKTWDVVNEAVGVVSYDSLTLREGPFLARLGIEYIANSFKRARSVDPGAMLVLNETHTERDDAFGLLYRRGLLALLDLLLDQGAPLDGVGLQGHIQSGVPFNDAAYAEFLNEISKRGLFIELTELDVNDKGFPDDIAARDARVADAYRRFLGIVLANKSVRSISFWQLADRASHYFADASYTEPGVSRRPRPLLFDLRYRPKPAFEAVLEVLKQAPKRS